jgi:hypothetical protein
MLSEDQLTAPAERVEAEFMYQYVSMAPPPVKKQLGIATARIGGGVALSVRNDVTGYWSKALGFGFTEPITHELIGRLLEFYRAEDSPSAVLQIAPSALPRDWEEIRAHYGIRPDSLWVKLACRITEFRPGQTGLLVAGVGPAAAHEWASVTLRGFEMPEDGLADMLAGQRQESRFPPVRGMGWQRNDRHRQPFRAR